MRELTARVGGCCFLVLVAGLAACGGSGASARARGADTAAAPAASVRATQAGS